MRSAHAWARALIDCEKPVIAAVNGAAVGGGRELARFADIIIASRDAYVLGGYARLGALPDLGPLPTLPWAIGSLRAKKMIMLNRRYGAGEAAAIGRCNRVVPACKCGRSARRSRGDRLVTNHHARHDTRGPHAGRNGSLMIGGPRQVRPVGCEPVPALLPHHVRVSHGAHTIRHPP